MFHNYDYHTIQMHAIRQATFLQEAEQERLVQATLRDTPPFYHHWAYLLGQGMEQLGKQLIRFGEAGQTSTGARATQRMPLQ